MPLCAQSLPLLQRYLSAPAGQIVEKCWTRNRFPRYVKYTGKRNGGWTRRDNSKLLFDTFGNLTLSEFLVSKPLHVPPIF